MSKQSSSNLELLETTDRKHIVRRKWPKDAVQRREAALDLIDDVILRYLSRQIELKDATAWVAHYAATILGNEKADALKVQEDPNLSTIELQARNLSLIAYSLHQRLKKRISVDQVSRWTVSMMLSLDLLHRAHSFKDASAGRKVRRGGKVGSERAHGPENIREARNEAMMWQLAYLCQFEDKAVGEAEGIIARRYGVTTKTVRNARKQFESRTLKDVASFLEKHCHATSTEAEALVKNEFARTKPRGRRAGRKTPQK